MVGPVRISGDSAQREVYASFYVSSNLQEEDGILRMFFLLLAWQFQLVLEIAEESQLSSLILIAHTMEFGIRRL
jgi:hypothetical protein